MPTDSTRELIVRHSWHGLLLAASLFMVSVGAIGVGVLLLFSGRSDALLAPYRVENHTKQPVLFAGIFHSADFPERKTWMPWEEKVLFRRLLKFDPVLIEPGGAVSKFGQEALIDSRQVEIVAQIPGKSEWRKVPGFGRDRFGRQVYRVDESVLLTGEVVGVDSVLDAENLGGASTVTVFLSWCAQMMWFVLMVVGSSIGAILIVKKTPIRNANDRQSA